MTKDHSHALIFIVEDDPLYVEILKYHLSLNPDNDVESFSTGQECLSQLHRKPDLVTLAFRLPDMQGDQVLKRIREPFPIQCFK